MSINDLLIDFLYGIVLLLMILIFVFRGILAFAPVSGFSAVMNSSLIAGAGAGTSSGGEKKEEEGGATGAGEEDDSAAGGDDAE